MSSQEILHRGTNSDGMGTTFLQQSEKGDLELPHCIYDNLTGQ